MAMAPNHSEDPRPDPDPMVPGAEQNPLGGDPTAGPPASYDDGPADTGSLSPSLLTAEGERPRGSFDHTTPTDHSGRPVIDADDLPPSRISRFDGVWASRQYVGGIPFVAREAVGAAQDLVAAALAGGDGEHVHLANAYSVSLANRFPVLAAETFCAGGWNLPDGRPISWLSGLRGDQPALQQVRGPQFMLDVCEHGVASGLQHFLLGSTPEVLAALEHALREEFPGIRIAGSFSPPFREPTDLELAERDAAIVASGAHVVWVGLGTPKQDREVARLARSTGLVAVAVGAAFDFAAGTLREAPEWMRRLGLEWLFRLMMEPRRLWRRYLIGNTHFIAVALRRGSKPWL
jgi:N-acetylglucosaminyldiphosphoundecaprenol N-acetyl-beta-D-mannosaminyltransferase